MNEIVVTGENAPALGSVEALADRKVFVRRSSSYDESLTALNTRLQAAGKPPLQIKLADEHLEGEDSVELKNALAAFMKTHGPGTTFGWFNNVETVAGRKIGRETVNYVRNILKYWVAYHLALDPAEDVQRPAA
jgi:hypothetical protein